MKHFTQLRTWLTMLLLFVGVSVSWGDTKTSSWDLTSTSTDWSASGNETYFSQPYGYKKANGTLVNKSISDFSTSNITQIKVGFKCLQNGANTSKLTIYLVDKDGKTLGNGVVVTPVNASAATKTEFVHATFTEDIANATGFMMKVSTFGKNILVNGAEYEVTYTSSGETPDTPEPTKYAVNIADDIAGGTISANPTSAVERATVTLIATPNDGYEFGSWNVTDESSNTITVTDNKFTMPASNVNVSATFNEVQVVARPENEIFYESFDTNNGTGGNDGQWSGSIASSTFYSDKEWTSENSSGANKCAKFGTGSKLGSATTPALGIACNATLTFKAAAWNGSSENTTLKLSLVGGGTIETKTVTLVKGEWTTYVVSIKNLTKTSKIKFEGEKVSNSRFFLDEVSVVMTEEIVPPADKELISIQADGTPAEFWKGDAFNHNGITVTALWDDDSKTDVTSLCTFSTPDMSAAGEKTVTITYLGEECSYHINVQTIANTQETAYTTAQAIALIDAGKDLDTEVYITGVVSKVDSYNDKYKSITYWLNDDSFEIYGGLAAEDEEFSSIDDIEVGATVVVLGKIANYKGTYEVNSNNHLVSYVAPVHETATITLNDACHDADGMVYGTYSNASAWVVPSDLEVSVIAVVDGSLFVEAFNTGDVVPANTGVMVSAMEGGNYTITLSNKYGVDPLEGAYENALRPSGNGITSEAMANADANCTYYRLTMHNGTQIGYWWGAADGAAFSLAANKAYLAVPKTAGVKANMWIGGDEDAIKSVEKEYDTVIYDMQGRKVSKAQKGLYIVNGKKVVR